jgi:hypothetical protein
MDADQAVQTASAVAGKAIDTAGNVAGKAIDAAGPVAAKFSENAGKALAMLIDKVASGIDSATSFLADQIPDVIRQLLVYNMVMSLLGCLLGLGIVIAIPFVCRWCFVKTKDKFPVKHTYNFDQMNWAVTWILCIWLPITIVGIAVFFTHLDWIQIWLAPKIYLIQYAAELVKSFTNPGQ